MPHPYKLNKFMKSVEDLVQCLANFAESVDYNCRRERIKNAIKEAYLAGYAQCDQDCHDNYLCLF